MSVKRWDIIDYWRGVAMLMIIIVHCGTYWISDYTAVRRFGQMGCQIFFVLSAFGLCQSFSQHLPTKRQFITRRFAQLAGGYWIIIIVYFILDYILARFCGQKIDEPTLFDWVVNIFLLNGLTPTLANNRVVFGGWFVGTLFLIYLIFPILYKLYFNNRHTYWVTNRIWLFPLTITLICTGGLYIAWMIDPNLACNNNSYIYFSFVNQLPCFTIGFSLYEQFGERERVKHYGLASLLLTTISIYLFYSDIPQKMTLTPTFVAISFALAFMATSSNSAPWIKRHLCNRILRWIGEYSFGIFLFHAIFCYKLDKFIADRIYDKTDTLIDILGLNSSYVSSVTYVLLTLVVIGLSSAVAIPFAKAHKWLANKIYILLI